MQFKRRYTHLFIVLTSYAFLIVVARWAFFTEMWTIMGTEPNVDGEHAHAPDLDFTEHIRTQRDLPTFDTRIPDSRSDELRYNHLSNPEVAQTLKSDYIARVNKRNQLLQNIFTNFLHP